tara:strand:- start:231 stop:965 length:735 start_codon:yes stop_codon:yes gene_type:complete
MIVIVLGMHRSGTSTFAGVLHMNKILMGNYETFWPRPLTQNPKGFYENYDFRKINDQILKLSGYYVKSYNTDIPSIDINDNLLLKMKKIVKEYNLRYENWGWKDPRTCLTVEYWVNIMQELDLSDDIKIIFVVRKALSVSRSLKKRNELPLEQGLELWKAYTERALKFCNGSQLPTHYCSFEALLKDPLSTCDSLFGFLNEQWDPKVVDQFVDSSITSSQKGEEVTSPEDIVRLESELYSRVEK